MIKTITLNPVDENASNLVTSLRETGFAVVTGHGIPDWVFDRCYEEWGAFFMHPTWKNRFTFKKETQYGYFPMRSETAKGASVSDIKEFYHFFGNNREQKLPPLPVLLDDHTREAFSALEKLSIKLLGIIQANTPWDSQPTPFNWSASVENSPSTLLRILHYPPVEGAVDGAVRAAAHEDINFITLLPAATQPGLQVKDNDGNWVDVSVLDPNSIIVNVGDMLAEATNGYYKSTTHRVVNPAGEANVSRLSMPLFLHPKPDTKLSERHTAHSYLMERLKELGLI